MRFAARRLQACRIHQRGRSTGARVSGRLPRAESDGWLACCDIRLHPPAGQKDVRPGRSDTVSHTGHGTRQIPSQARLVSDVSGSLQACLGISTGGAHLILMSQVCDLLLLTRRRPLRPEMQTKSITTMGGGR
jgi:hypothetical protein